MYKKDKSIVIKPVTDIAIALLFSPAKMPRIDTATNKTILKEGK